MTTVKRFIDRLGTQKSRSCQKKHKACDTLKDIERSTKPVETAKIHILWVAYCMWNSHLFILSINPEATKGKRSVLPMERIWQRAFQAQNFSIPIWTFAKDSIPTFILYPPTYNSLQTFQTCSSCYPTQLLTLETECWNDVLHQGILSSYTVDSS